MSAFRIVAGLIVLASLAGAGWVGSLQFREAEEANLPIAPVRAGEFLAVIRTRGQIQAEVSRPVYAPMVQDLRIAWMAPGSEIVEAGEPMVRFDSSTAERDLIQRRAAMEQARAALERAIVDGDVAAQRDESDLVDARFNVEIARLRTANSEFVGRLEAEEGEIDLRIAEQNLRQLEAEIEQRVVSRQSQIASLERQLEQAETWVELVASSIERMEVRAPLTGYPIYATSSNSLAAALSGQAQQPIRIGDQVSAGRNIATIPDMSSLLIDVTVEEIDRGKIRGGDDVIVRIDALPEVLVRTTLSGISPLAEVALDSRQRSFHAYAALGDDVDPRIRPGMNGSMDIIVDRIPKTHIIPAQALFTRNGKPTVYVVAPDGFRAREVEVLTQNSDEVAVEGLDTTDRVALADPFAESNAETAAEEAGPE